MEIKDLEKGFTLVEVLVAIALSTISLLGLAVIVGFGAWDYLSVTGGQKQANTNTALSVSVSTKQPSQSESSDPKAQPSKQHSENIQVKELSDDIQSSNVEDIMDSDQINDETENPNRRYGAKNSTEGS